MAAVEMWSKLIILGICAIFAIEGQFSIWFIHQKWSRFNFLWIFWTTEFIKPVHQNRVIHSSSWSNFCHFWIYSIWQLSSAKFYRSLRLDSMNHFKCIEGREEWWFANVITHTCLWNKFLAFKLKMVIDSNSSSELP